MTRGKELLFGAILALFGISLAAVMLEVGVRVLHLTPDRLWEPDPLVGARLAPGKSGWWTQEDREFVVPVRINSQRLRDVEHTYEKPANVFRVLVLGDSFVEAMHVPLDAVFTRRLETLLNAAGLAKRVEVIAAGVSGYGTVSELLWFRQEGVRYQPDVVLLSFYPGNDVKNNSPVLEDVLRPEYDAQGEPLRVVGVKKKALHGWRALVVRSKAYQFLRQLVLVRQPHLAQWLVRMHLLDPRAIRKAPERDGYPVDFGVYEEPLSPDWNTAWKHTEHLLDLLKRDVVAAGARLAVMVVSTRDQVYPASWQQIIANTPAMQQRTWNLDAPLERVRKWCDQASVPCIPMTPVFRANATKSDEPLHFAHDGHWTAAGHQLAARTLADFFLAKSILKPTE